MQDSDIGSNSGIAPGMQPETAQFLDDLSGIGTPAYLDMTQADIPKFRDWRDANFAPDNSGNYMSREGQAYTNNQLKQMHGVLSQEAGNPLVSQLFNGPKSWLADYMTWRNQNFDNPEGGAWEDEAGTLYSEPALQEMFQAKSNLSPSSVSGPAQNATTEDAQQESALGANAVAPSETEPPIVDVSGQVTAPSQIPKQSADPAAPSLSAGLDAKQQRRALNTLMTGIRNPSAIPLGVEPDGSLVRNISPLVKAPSRIPRQYDSGDYFSNVNIGLIKGNEGGSLTKGYVPPPDQKGRDNSGVTIAAGYDLGQHTVADLRNLGLSKDLISKLSPYLGLHGDDARDAIKQNPLTLAKDEAAQIDKAAFQQYPNAAGAAFNTAKASLPGQQNSNGQELDPDGNPAEFKGLPWQAQTVISDLWYNMGDLSVKAPNLWRQMTTGDWEGAYRNLRDFSHGDPVLARRARRDARLLRDALDIGTLPE